MKRILLLLLCILSFGCISTYAFTPFPGGPVTGPWLEQRPGYTHKGLDIAMPEGTPIYAPFDGYVEGAPGGGFVYWITITSPNGQTFLFADCAFESAYCARGNVTEGTLIGYVGGAHDSELGYSSGDHVHVEYHPWGYDSNGGMVDPTPYLLMLGVNLNGYTGGGDTTIYGKDDVGVPWGIQGMYEIGNDFNETIKTFVTAANKAFTYLHLSLYVLLFLLCVIDFTAPILISGMGFSMRQFLTKSMRYAGLFALLTCWDTFTNDILLKFVTATSGTLAGTTDVISQNMSQPQLLLQHGIRMVLPALNKISTFTMFEYLQNIGSILTLYAFTALVIACFIAVALYVTVVYIEFYVSAALSVVTVPFAAWNFTRFLPEGGVGHLVTTTLKLLFVSVLIALCVNTIKDAQPNDLFKATMTGQTVTGTGQVTGPADLVAMAENKAAKYGIPANLFKALIQTESSWNPHAESEAGAQGLGQLMPDTALDLGCSDPFNPEQNLDASAKYMKQLYEMYGDWDYVLAAYNGGPGNVPQGAPIDPLYQQYIDHVKSNLNGSYTSHSPITAEQVAKYMRYCLALIFLTLLILFIPRRLTKAIGGPLELPRT